MSVNLKLTLILVGTLSFLSIFLIKLEPFFLENECSKYGRSSEKKFEEYRWQWQDSKHLALILFSRFFECDNPAISIKRFHCKPLYPKNIQIEEAKQI